MAPNLPTRPGFGFLRLGRSDGLSIWDLLKESRCVPSYRRLAIVAWGGYGKTTLLRHVAYMYAKRKTERGVPKLLPVFLRLRDWQNTLATAVHRTASYSIFLGHTFSLASRLGKESSGNWENVGYVRWLR